MARTYTGIITKLEPNQIFVFGSNIQGRHSEGAALYALQWFGAKYGNPQGLQGQSYAIITKDLTQPKHPSIPEEYIIAQIKELYEFAQIHGGTDFVIAYPGIKYNLNGYAPTEMADMFVVAGYNFETKKLNIPQNIIFENNFLKLMETCHNTIGMRRESILQQFDKALHNTKYDDNSNREYYNSFNDEVSDIP